MPIDYARATRKLPPSARRAARKRRGSKVVHGGEVARQRLAEHAAESKELLRVAILAWLDSGGYDSDALDELLLA
jgi:hypothetical protein